MAGKPAGASGNTAAACGGPPPKGHEWEEEEVTARLVASGSREPAWVGMAGSSMAVAAPPPLPPL